MNLHLNQKDEGVAANHAILSWLHDHDSELSQKAKIILCNAADHVSGWY